MNHHDFSSGSAGFPFSNPSTVRNVVFVENLPQLDLQFYSGYSPTKMHSKHFMVLASARMAMIAHGASGNFKGGGYSTSPGYQSNGHAPTATHKSPDGAAATVANTALAGDSIAAAQATAKTLSPTSDVKGSVFDRIIQIYLETTAYNNTIADRTPPCGTPFQRREVWLTWWE